MIRVSIMYPRSDDSTFDMDYYLKSHMPLVQREVGDALKGVEVDEGVGGDHPAPYHCIGFLTFDSVDAFFTAMAGAPETAADMPNFTNATPQVQISEIRL
jgi:uncharacterized protein (TIGR02118 family)